MAGWTNQTSGDLSSGGGSGSGSGNMRRVQICVVETKQEFYDSIEELFRADEVAISGQKGANQGHQGGKGNLLLGFAVLQVSSLETCYIYKLMALLRDLTSAEWQTFAQGIILNGQIKKIGYRIDELMRMLTILATRMMTDQSAREGRPNIIDLYVLENQIMEECPTAFETLNPISQHVVKGLPELVQSCLSQTLDTTQQHSHWEHHNLTTSQLDYAAMEAYRMIELYKTMKLIVSIRHLKVKMDETLTLGEIVVPKTRSPVSPGDRGLSIIQPVSSYISSSTSSSLTSKIPTTEVDLGSYAGFSSPQKSGEIKHPMRSFNMPLDASGSHTQVMLQHGEVAKQPVQTFAVPPATSRSRTPLMFQPEEVPKQPARTFTLPPDTSRSRTPVMLQQEKQAMHPGRTFDVPQAASRSRTPVMLQQADVMEQPARTFTLPPDTSRSRTPVMLQQEKQAMHPGRTFDVPQAASRSRTPVMLQQADVMEGMGYSDPDTEELYSSGYPVNESPGTKPKPQASRLGTLHLDGLNRKQRLKLAALLLSEDVDGHEATNPRKTKEPKSPKKICPYYAAGRRCPRAACDLEHHLDSSPPQAICRDFQMPEGCALGKRCTQIHEKVPLGICIDFNSIRGCNRAQCKYRHVTVAVCDSVNVDHPMEQRRGNQRGRKICHYFATARGCQREDCEFEHSLDSRTQPAICRDFQTPAGCPRGEHCFHLHEKLPDGICSDFNSAKGCDRLQCKFRHEKVSVGICVHFNTSRGCKRPQCEFRHEKVPPGVCVDFNSIKGCNRFQCKYRHVRVKDGSDARDNVKHGVTKSPDDATCKKLQTTVQAESKLVPTTTPMSVYQVELVRQLASPSNKSRDMYFGKCMPGKTEKVIMLVGATGAGKSTLINSMLNTILGVKFEDDFRFQLTQENHSANQAESQTQRITAYRLYHQDGFSIPYSLTIIDTPGFGDTSGIERDKTITGEMKAFFDGSGRGGVDHIDAIGFVIQSALPRLTHTQRYIFDSILSIFGKDIAENICLFVTFADSSEPPVLSAVKAANIAYTKYYKFNNSALFVNSRTRDIVDEKTWAMNIFNVQIFFDDVLKVEPKSLVLTREVLDERGRLENLVTEIQLDIQSALTKLEQLAVEKDVLGKHEAEIERNKNFTYEVEEEVVRKEATSAGHHTTTCLTCNRTCHKDCKIPDDDQKRGCWAMDQLQGVCRICPGKCDWQIHKNLPYILVVERQKVSKTSAELKQRYKTARGKQLSANQLVQAIVDDVKNVQDDVLNKVKVVRTILKRLLQIALKPNPLSELDYIDLLIDAEEKEGRPGWKKRREQLQIVRQRATYLQEMNKPNFDPFAKYGHLQY